MIIVTPNIEEGPSEGGLDGKIEDILKDCKNFSVPVVFALTRNKLGKAFGRVSEAKNVKLLLLVSVFCFLVQIFVLLVPNYVPHMGSR